MTTSIGVPLLFTSVVLRLQKGFVKFTPQCSFHVSACTG